MKDEKRKTKEETGWLNHFTVDITAGFKKQPI